MPFREVRLEIKTCVPLYSGIVSIVSILTIANLLANATAADHWIPAPRSEITGPESSFGSFKSALGRQNLVMAAQKWLGGAGC